MCQCRVLLSMTASQGRVQSLPPLRHHLLILRGWNRQELLNHQTRGLCCRMITIFRNQPFLRPFQIALMKAFVRRNPFMAALTPEMLFLPKMRGSGIHKFKTVI